MASVTRRPASVWPDSTSDEESFAALSAEQALDWRQRHPQRLVAHVLGLQAGVGVVVVMAAWLWLDTAQAVGSALWGVLAGVMPTWLAARGMARWAAPGFPPGAALAGFLLWEMVKLGLTMGMLLAAPKILGVPSWPALLIGLALTIMMYWLALWTARPSRSRQGQAQNVNNHGC